LIWRCARGLGTALTLYLVRQRRTGPESVPELVRSQLSGSAPDCDSESVPDSDGGGGVTKEGICDGSEDMAWWDPVEIEDMTGSSSNVTCRVGEVMAGCDSRGLTCTSKASGSFCCA